jgi:hypothetical protein
MSNGNGSPMMFRATLRDGTPVVGKMYKGQVTPAQYANRTQANKRAALCGGVVIKRLGRPFYVMLPERSV